MSRVRDRLTKTATFTAISRHVVLGANTTKQVTVWNERCVAAAAGGAAYGVKSAGSGAPVPCQLAGKTTLLPAGRTER